MKTIEEVKDAHEAELLALADVISIGIGKEKSGYPAIIVGLAGPNPQSEAKIPSMIEEYPVILRISGLPEAQLKPVY